MSQPPEDEPTRRVPPARPREAREPVAREPVVREPVARDPHVRTWEEELADRISSVRNWLAVVGVIAVAALGISIYAALEANKDDDTSNGSGASSAPGAWSSAGTITRMARSAPL